MWKFKNTPKGVFFSKQIEIDFSYEIEGDSAFCVQCQPYGEGRQPDFVA